MAPKNRPFALALAVLGPLSVCPQTRGQEPVAPRDDVPTASASAATPPLPASEPAAAPIAPPTIHLMTNGEVLQGILSEDPQGFYLTQRLGKIRFPKGRLVRSFRSLDEIYAYRAARLPQGDVDEAMKLAKWSLSYGLVGGAREQLGAVLTMAPAHAQARAMLEKMAADEERMAQRQAAMPIGQAFVGPDGKRDVDIVPAGVGPDNRPNVLRAGGPAAPGVPTIFNLPPAMAARKAREFENGAHLVLQQRCAVCHNERSATNFQLIQVQGKRIDPAAIRFNLEATLTQVDPADLVRSPLLVGALMPHQPSNKPILAGPNDPAYRALAYWVQGLNPTGKPIPARPSALTATLGNDGAPIPGGEVFAGDRAPGRPATIPGELPGNLTAPPLAPGSGMRMPSPAPEDPNYPEPFLVTGKKPSVPSQASGPANPARPGTTPPTAVPTAAPAAPMVPLGLPDLPPAAVDPTPKALPKKAKKIDASDLEKLYRARTPGMP